MNRKNFNLSIVTCAYNEEKNISLFVYSVVKNLEYIHPKISTELIIVDDGSTDETWNEIMQVTKNISKQPKNKLQFTCIKLISNFGQMQALEAGLQKANGSFILTMDCDLQTPPSYIPTFWQARDSNAIIAGKQKYRNEKKIKAFLSKTFYNILQKTSKHNISSNTGDFRLYPKYYVNELLKIKNNFKVFRFLAPKLGIPVKILIFESQKRINGKSSYNLKKMITLAKNSLFNLSLAPSKVVLFYLSLFIIYFIGICIYAIHSYLTQELVPGWTSISLSISFGFIGVLTILYVIIEYLVKNIENTQNFPAYIIQKITTIK